MHPDVINEMTKCFQDKFCVILVKFKVRDSPIMVCYLAARVVNQNAVKGVLLRLDSMECGEAGNPSGMQKPFD